MSRRSRAESEEAFSLFPFLAVLLCTMGTLALVFVLIAQKTSSDEQTQAAESVVEEFDADAGLGDVSEYGSIIGASELAAAMNGGLEKDAEDQENSAYEEALVKTGAATLEEVLDEKESVEWFMNELDEIRSHSDELFEEERQRLANAEAGIAKLREEADLAQRRYDALMNEGEDDEDADELRKQIAALDQALEELQEEAAELRDQNANAKKSYAIVPYQGKKGTFRRPIYVECNDSGVFIKPENVRFDERDFLLAQYPGNPFDTALRAASQRILTTGGQKTITGEAIEPYPLVIVRPSGSRYFYSAIAALASWGELYGYEFVEEDQELEYPAPDPVLAKVAADQANDARARMQAQLAAALSIRNARLVAEERARRGARPGGSGDGAPTSELQSRLGSNVRLGAANPLANAGGKPNGGRLGDGLAARGGTIPSSPAPAIRPGTPTTIGAAPSVPSVQGLATNVAGGGVFTGAAGDVGARSARAATGGDLGPSVSYVGRFSQNAAPANGGDGVGPENLGGDGQTQVGESAGANSSDATGELAQSRAYADDATESDASSATLDGVSESAPFDGTTRRVENAAATAQETARPGAETPLYMKNFVAAPESSQPSDPAQSRDLSNTLGNTTFGVGATGEGSTGSLAKSDAASDSASAAPGVPNVFDKTVSLDDPVEPKPAIRDDETPKEAFLVSRELTRTATRGNERGIVVRCGPNGYVFPKQPGLRASYTVPYQTSGKTRADRDAELADVVTLCVKSWGLAGRDMYWAPYLKIEVEQGGEQGLQELQEFCQTQGLTFVLAKAPDSAVKTR